MFVLLTNVMRAKVKKILQNGTCEGKKDTLLTINITKINTFQPKVFHFSFCFKTYNYYRMLTFIFSKEIVRSQNEITCFQLKRFVFKYTTCKFSIILTSIAPIFKFVVWNPTDICLKNFMWRKARLTFIVKFFKIFFHQGVNVNSLFYYCIEFF